MFVTSPHGSHGEAPASQPRILAQFGGLVKLWKAPLCKSGESHAFPIDKLKILLKKIDKAMVGALEHPRVAGASEFAAWPRFKQTAQAKATRS